MPLRKIEMMKRTLYIFGLTVVSFSCNYEKNASGLVKSEMAADVIVDSAGLNQNTNHAKVIVDGLALREYPMLEAKIIISIPEDTEVQLLNERTNYTNEITLREIQHDEPWYKISIDRQEGWVYGGGISLKKDALDKFSILKVLPFPETEYQGDDASTTFQKYIEENFIQYASQQIDTSAAEEAYMLSFKSNTSQVHINIIREIYGLGELTRTEISNSSFPEVLSIVQKLYPHLGKFKISEGNKSFTEKNTYEGVEYNDEYFFEVKKDAQGNAKEVQLKLISIGPSTSIIKIYKKDDKIIAEESYDTT